MLWYLTMTNTPPRRVPGFDCEPPAWSKPPPTRATKPVDTITLRGTKISLGSDIGTQFVIDAARNREKIFSDARLREKYSIDSDADWNDIVNNKPLRLAVSKECEKRVLRGDTAREAAAQEFIAAPKVLGTILNEKSASPRHRIEASKELRATARSDDEKAGADTERVIVTINLGSAPEDRLVYDCGPLKQKQDTTDGETESW